MCFFFLAFVSLDDAYFLSAFVHRKERAQNRHPSRRHRPRGRPKEVLPNGSRYLSLLLLSSLFPLSLRSLLILPPTDLGLRHTYFLGPHQQSVLAKLYTIASVCVFPSFKVALPSFSLSLFLPSILPLSLPYSLPLYSFSLSLFPSLRLQEPFGMVFVESMACGSPVIGANSGGPKDFVSPEVSRGWGGGLSVQCVHDIKCVSSYHRCFSTLLLRAGGRACG